MREQVVEIVTAEGLLEQREPLRTTPMEEHVRMHPIGNEVLRGQWPHQGGEVRGERGTTGLISDVHVGALYLR
jgi:hypothetical protein